ncbi:hypothetical protein FA15DRAFT_660723 [Coprinopsis marcescibilis]|uniref:TERF2-interacting telomeric protein 1 Myb domain-containing protein n=1 Tax=Coprinopsis marcescibilis TaxID=230819 RepID=A0A5C3KED4_COPMA|nr:hypothetical protein FA15DRAFT_660723 [Coprinopsis marcescibilis]
MYIAKYNPDVAGRSGNALYQQLEDNKEGKWNWSRRHSWQSWRARYTKNQSLFDAKIARHQKKAAAAETKTAKPSKPVPQTQAGKRRMSDLHTADDRQYKRVRLAGNADKDGSRQVPNKPAETSSNPATTQQATSGDPKPVAKPKPKPKKANPAPPLKSSDTENESVAGIIHSNDYRNELFQEEEEETSTSDRPQKEEEEEESPTEDIGMPEEPSEKVKEEIPAIHASRGTPTNIPERIYPHIDSIPPPGFPVGPEPTKMNVKPADFAASTPRSGKGRDTPEMPLVEASPIAIPLRKEYSQGSKPHNTAPEKTEPAVKPNPKPKVKAKGKNFREDPFVSSHDTSEDEHSQPSVAPVPPQRQMPVYKETGFRNTFASQWPPKRNGAGKPKATATSQIAGTKPPPQEAQEPSIAQPPPNPSTIPVPAPVPSGLHVNAEATSSKIKLPPSNYRSREEVLSSVQPSGSNIPPRPPQTSPPGSISSVVAKSRTNGQHRTSKVTNGHSEPTPRATEDDNAESISGSLKPRRIKDARSKPHAGSGVITGASVTLVEDSGELASAPVRLDDIFDTNGSKVPAPLNHQVYIAPRIDLREASIAFKKLKSRGSGSSRQSSLVSETLKQKAKAAPPRRSSGREAPNSDTADMSFDFKMAGMQVLSMLAKQYEFADTVAFKAYADLRDISKVDKFLSKLHARAKEEGNSIMRSMKSHDGDDGEDDDEVVGDMFPPPAEALKASRPAKPPSPAQVPRTKVVIKTDLSVRGSVDGGRKPNGTHTDLSKQQNARESLDNNQRRRSSIHRQQVFEIRPLDETELPELDYHPPRSSRAARHLREKLSTSGQNNLLNGPDSVDGKRRQSESPFVDLRAQSVPRSSPIHRAMASMTRSPPIAQDSPSPPEKQTQQKQKAQGRSVRPTVPLRSARISSAVPSSASLYEVEDSDVDMEDEVEEEGDEEEEEDEDEVEEDDDEEDEDEDEDERGGEHDDVPERSEHIAAEVSQLSGAKDNKQLDEEDANGVNGKEVEQPGISKDDEEEADDAMDIEQSLLSSPASSHGQTWDQDNPRSRAWQEISREHDELALRVTNENIEEFRAFEDSIDPDDMRALSILLLKKMLEKKKG